MLMHTFKSENYPRAAQMKYPEMLMPGSPARGFDLIGLECGLGIWIFKSSLDSSNVQPGSQTAALWNDNLEFINAPYTFEVLSACTVYKIRQIVTGQIPNYIE